VSRRIPPWLDWDLRLTDHILERMVDRRFNEVDLREMLESPVGVGVGAVAGRRVLQCELDGRDWKMVVEPERDEQKRLVVTAYPAGSDG